MPRMSVFHSRFFWKIYLTFSILFLSTTVVVSWVVVNRVQSALQDTAFDSLRGKVALLMPAAADALSGKVGDVEALIHALGATSDTRITLIAKDGHVISDSLADWHETNNHLDRPEIQQSILRPFGFSERFSETLGERMLYAAKAIKSGDELIGFVRVALPFGKIDKELSSARFTISLVVILGNIIALGTGWILTQKVAVPITEMMLVAEGMRVGKYDRKVTIRSRDEIGRLGDTLNKLGSELTKQITELKRLENVRRDFVANVSHEIKTPLTSIKGYVETLMNGAINEAGLNLRFLEKIDRNATRLSELVQDILSLAKIESQEAVFKAQPTDWNPIVTSVLARYEDTILQKSLKIKVNEHAEHLMVMGDKEAMTQVLDNLLTNAVKYTPAGGRITVTLSQKGSWGKVEVEDTGIGIPTQHLDRIFERFYRVDKARSRDMGGTGLGLSIVKHLVSGMSGEIGVDSSVGVGSRFTVRLKLAS